MSESEAKQYVLDSIEQCRKALSTLDSADSSALGDQRKSIEEVVQVLEGLKEKVFLKTKKATKPAYLVLEASQSVAEYAEDAAGDDDEDAIGEFGEAVAGLKENLVKLEGASKQHSVIVT